jgi:hypothetical protein
MDNTHQLLRDGSCASRHLASLSASQCLIERDANRLVGKIIAGLRVGLQRAPEIETVLEAWGAAHRLADHVAQRDLAERTADKLLRAIQAGFDLLLPLGEPAQTPPVVGIALLDQLRKEGLRTGASLARMAREAADREAACGQPAVLDWSPPADLAETVDRMQAVIDQLPDRTPTVGHLRLIEGDRA